MSATASQEAGNQSLARRAVVFNKEVEMTRSEHVQWCKDRALEYLPTDPNQAFASMASDLQKHPETEGHIGVHLGMMQMMTGGLSDAASMRKFIDGFN